MAATFLTRETGTFSVNGNKITLSPSTNVIEAWSKSNGGDNFKQLRSQQKKPLEKTTYQNRMITITQQLLINTPELDMEFAANNKIPLL